MKRFFQRVKQHAPRDLVKGFLSVFGLKLTPVSPPVTEPTKGLRLLPPVDQIQVGYGEVHYQPADDEPSIFCTTPGCISERWAAWYIRSNPGKGYLALFHEAHRIKQLLSVEHPREVDANVAPDLLVGPTLSISFKWVIWYKYAFKVTFQEAHQHAVMYKTPI